MSRRGFLSAALITLAFAGSAHASGPDSIFSGNRAFSEAELLDHLSRRNQPAATLAGGSADAIERTLRLLRQFYQDHGFPLALVRLQSTPPDFRFLIVEGPRAELGWVEFQGNQALSSAELSRLLDLKGPLDFNALEEGLERLRSRYRDAGHPQVEIHEPVVEVVEVEEPDHFPVPFRQVQRFRVRVSVAVEEGPLFRYRKIAADHALDPLRENLPVSGQIYRQSDLERLRERVFAHFLADGAIVKEFQIYQNLSQDSAEADLRIACHIFPPLTLKRIGFEGHQRYPDSFYRRELTFQEEEILDPRKIEESLAQLMETGALSEIGGDDVELAVREDRLEADLILHLHEKDRQKILFSLGPDGWGGLETSVFYSALNLLGLGEKLGLDLNVGSSSSELAVSLASRYLLGTQIPASMALRFFRRNTRFELPGAEDRLRTLFSTSASGFAAAGQYRIRPRQTAELAGSAQRVSRPLRTDHFTLTPGWSRIEKSDGGSEALRASTRFSLLEGESDSWNWRADFSFSRGFDRQNLKAQGSSVRVHAVHARFFGDPAPLFERLLKDDQELRGFSFLSGPWAETAGQPIPIGGDSLLTVSGEYQFPLAESASLVPFFDGGLNFASQSPDDGRLIQATNRVWRASLGTEIRLRPFRQLPGTRLIFSWNALRLDRVISTSRGLARLRDPALSFQVGFF